MTAPADLADPFATSSDIKDPPKRFGNVYNGRYHMPCLPGEETVKSLPKDAAPWVPYGVTRVTNLAGAFVDSEALSVWEQELAMVGLVIDPSLYEEVALLVGQMRAEGIPFTDIKHHSDIRQALTGTWKERDSSIVGRAKQAAGANVRRQMGTNRHFAWQVRGETGEMIGTPEITAQIEALEQLLRDAHLERVPGLTERVVRNVTVRCAGRFDDILCDTRTGEMFMADLKTKVDEFFTWTEMDIQLAVYAYAEWMLWQRDPGVPPPPDGEVAGYVRGPVDLVNLERGVVLHMPSDGGEPKLRRADLVRGWKNALMAREIMDERSYGRSAERFALAEWTG